LRDAQFPRRGRDRTVAHDHHELPELFDIHQENHRVGPCLRGMGS
jgi:hypothetical protein